MNLARNSIGALTTGIGVLSGDRKRIVVPVTAVANHSVVPVLLLDIAIVGNHLHFAMIALPHDDGNCVLLLSDCSLLSFSLLNAQPLCSQLNEPMSGAHLLVTILQQSSPRSQMARS